MALDHFKQMEAAMNIGRTVGEKSKEAAKELPKLAAPEIGGIYTISQNKVTGDRSYCGDIFRVLSVNELHIAVRHLDAEEDHYWKGKPHILNRNEHEFAPAKEMATALGLLK